MKKEKQHFVPKAYLKHFCIQDKSEIYQSRYLKHKKRWLNPISKHPNSICYSENLYNVSLRFAKANDIDFDYVERNAFWYEKRFIDDIIVKIENGSIQKSDVDRLPEFYLSMISRNPIFMHGFDTKIIEELLDLELASLRNESSWVKKVAKLTSDEEFDEWFSMLRSKFLSEQTQQKMYSTSIFKQCTGQSSVFNEILSKVRGYKVMIGTINSEDHFFVTSDSPGFSVAQDGSIYTLKFNDDAFHYMPLSSKVMVALLHPVYAFHTPQFSVGKVSKEAINFINNGTIKASTEYIYCENKQFLSGLIGEQNSK